jgi:hypothetical protein
MRRCREHTFSRPQTLVLELTASNRLKSVEGGSHGAHQGIQAIQRRKSDNITFAPISRPFLCASQKKTLFTENISPLFSIQGFRERFAPFIARATQDYFGSVFRFRISSTLSVLYSLRHVKHLSYFLHGVLLQPLLAHDNARLNFL